MAKKKKESFEEYKKRTQKESIKTNTGEKESFESFMKKRQKNMSTEYGAYMDRADILKSIAEGRKNSIERSLIPTELCEYVVKICEEVIK